MVPESLAVEPGQDLLAVAQEAQLEMSVRVATLRDLNTISPLRSRELSVALTNFETGLMWLERAIEDERAVRDVAALAGSN